MNQKKIINYTLYIYYFFSILLITTLKYEVLYLNTLIGIALIFLINIYKINSKEQINNKFDFSFKSICYIYSAYVVIMALVVEVNNSLFIKENLLSLIYAINKVVPIILLPNLMDYYRLSNIDKEKLKRYLKYLFVLGVVTAAILYFFFDISFVQIGYFSKYVTKQDMIYNYNQGRLSGFLSHKSRFGVYCIMAIMLVLTEKKLKRIFKISLAASIVIISFFSNSLITFVASLFTIVMYLLFESIDKIKSFIKKRSKIMIILIVVITIGVILLLAINIGAIYSDREFATLGKRTIIWKYSIEYIKSNIWGVVRIPQDLALGGFFFMNNAHNIFLNEFIETGIIGGILYIIIVFKFIKFIEKPFIKVCYLIIILCGQFDKMIANEITFIFWGLFPIYVANTKVDCSKKKILFVIWSFTAGGGAEKILSNVVNNLNPNKYDITILEYINYNVKKERINDNIKVLPPMMYHDSNVLGKMKNKLIKFMTFNCPWILRKMYIKENYDIEVAFNYMIPSFIIKGAKGKKYTWVHSSIEDLDYSSERENNNYKKIKRNYELQKQSFKAIDNIIAISNKTEESICKVYPEYKHKVTKIYNGYDFANIISSSEVEVENIREDNKYTLIAVGRLVKQKNFIFLIDVAKKLVNQNIKFNLFIIGDGEQRYEIEEKIKKEGISDCVHLLGYINNPYPYIKQSDIFCLSSIAEGFPTVLVEALALGCPFISTNVAGVEELSSNGSSGLVAADLDSYTNNLIKMLSNKQLRENMSKAGVKLVQDYSLENQIKKIEKIFDRG